MLRLKTTFPVFVLTIGLLFGGAWLAGRLDRPVPARSPGAGTATRSHETPPTRAASSSPSPASQALALAGDAYDRGRWSDSERLARRVLESAPAGDDSGAAALRARWVLAFSAARRGHTRLARRRFALLRDEASKHPSLAFRSTRAAIVRGESRDSATDAVPPDRPVSETGEPLPTLEEEGAYQHAVLAAALAAAAVGSKQEAVGGKRTREEASALSSPTPEAQRPTPREAEGEFLDFIRRYPESPLVHAAVRRIARMHGGDLPEAAEAARKEAVAEAGRRERLRARARSMCGPEVLAELLRRRSGVQPLNTEPLNTERLPMERLAREMATDHRGTPLSGFVRAARNHGIVLKGYRLTWDGLSRKLWKSPPVVALVDPGHLVIVERADYTGVRIWDPALRENGGFRDVPRLQWDRDWAPSGQGVALAAP